MFEENLAMAAETEGGGARQIIRREGEYWTLVFAGEVCRLKDTSGMRYLAHLLRRPHERVAAFDIERGQRGEGVSETEAADPAALERARVNVQRAVAATLKRLEVHHPELAQHLRATLRTGKFCTYSPDPRITSSWESEQS